MLGFFTFALVLSILIIVHEWGHFFVAQRLGIRVERFSIGFGPVIGRWQGKDTEFCVSAIPLGGYVKLAGETHAELTGAGWEFNSRPPLQRFGVIAAGPFLNALLAFVLFSIVYWSGYPTPTTEVGSLVEGFPAQKAGVQAGDQITEIDGQKVTNWEELLERIRSHTQGELVLAISRKGETRSITLAPVVREVAGLPGGVKKINLIGVAPSKNVTFIKTPLLESIGLGFKRVVELTGLILMSLWMIITGALSFKESMTGPVGIYFLTQEAIRLGIVYLLHFMATLSVSLFVFNLFPIPALDGGHLLFIVIEAIKGNTLSEKFKERMTQAGFAFLMVLIVFVICQDLSRFEVVDKMMSLWKSKAGS